MCNRYANRLSYRAYVEEFSAARIPLRPAFTNRPARKAARPNGAFASKVPTGFVLPAFGIAHIRPTVSLRALRF